MSFFAYPFQLPAPVRWLRQLCFHFVWVLLMLITTPVLAERLTIDRIHADPALSGPTVRGLQISPDGSRVTFLRGRTEDQFQLDLWEYHLKDKTARRLINSATLAPHETLSVAEQARRERDRSASFKGIHSYSWSPDGARLLIPLAGNLYLVDLAAPDHARQVASGDVLDAKISPQGKYLSFVRGQNLFVQDLATGVERQLTQGGGGTIHNAEAEFVAQEEMGQTSGYWWAPDDSRIAYKRFDEAPVTLARRFEIQASRTDVVEQRYPAAGEANVLVSLHVVDVASCATQAIDLGADKDIYLVRADWSADAKDVVFQRQTRNLKRLDLIALSVASGQQRTLLSETSATWVNVTEPPQFLKSRRAFTWQSERTGRNHVYLIDLDGAAPRAITSGDWGVDEVLAVDEAGGQVFVSSNRDAVIDQQVYAIALDGSTANAPRRITQALGTHIAKFSKNGQIFVDTFSDPNTPPQVSIHQADGSFVAWVERNEVNATHPYAPFLSSHVATEYGTLKAADGQEMYYAIKKPLGFDPNKRYPVFLTVYGGPGVQNVRRQWDDPFEQFMAQKGYVVFKLDNRGSSRRERAFTDVIYQHMGQTEVQDQLIGIDWLRQQSFVDPARIGVSGWSYGGFMTLRLLNAASDRIKAGVSGAPVTNWALYDTYYTERFMQTPQENPAGYAQSSVFAQLPGLTSRLLLIHGMADDNVLFTNTTSLIDALVNQGTQFDLLTYPGAKHGLATPQSKKHRLHAIDAFFARELADK